MIPKKTPAARPAAKEKEPIESLERQLSELRTTLREVTERFHLRWQAELVTLHDKVRSAKGKSGWKKFSSTSLRQLEELKLRPKRGRLKDLFSIKQFVMDLKERLPR